MAGNVYKPPVAANPQPSQYNEKIDFLPRRPLQPEPRLRRRCLATACRPEQAFVPQVKADKQGVTVEFKIADGYISTATR